MNPLSRAASLVCVVVFVCAIPVGHAQEHSRAAANPLPLLSVSDSWTYQAFDGDGKATARIVATAVQLSDDGARIQYRVEGSLDRFADAVYDPRGRLVQEARPLDRETVKYLPPRVDADWPLVPGKEWQSDAKAEAHHWHCDTRSRFRVVGWETVNVPAGRFEVVRVEWTTKVEGGARDDGTAFSGDERGTYWYSPDAHAVARIEYESAAGVRQRRDLATFHLN